MNPNISYTELPSQSRLNQYIKDSDFCDCILVPDQASEQSVSQLTQLAFGKMPSWIVALMKLRNMIVGVFGLKTGGENPFNQELPNTLTVGDKIGVFNVDYIDENEIILGEDDKHLNFRISLLKSENGVVLSTWVKTHNLFGKAYLTIIMPFHRLITQHTGGRLLGLLEQK